MSQFSELAEAESLDSNGVLQSHSPTGLSKTSTQGRALIQNRVGDCVLALVLKLNVNPLRVDLLRKRFLGLLEAASLPAKYPEPPQG